MTRESLGRVIFRSFIAAWVFRLRKSLKRWTLSPTKKSAKFSSAELTARYSALFYQPRWKRDSSNQGVRSTYIWDCKLELNFVPAWKRKRDPSRLRDWVFCRPRMCERAGSL